MDEHRHKAAVCYHLLPPNRAKFGESEPCATRSARVDRLTYWPGPTRPAPPPRQRDLNGPPQHLAGADTTASAAMRPVQPSTSRGAYVGTWPLSSHAAGCTPSSTGSLGSRTGCSRPPRTWSGNAVRTSAPRSTNARPRAPNTPSTASTTPVTTPTIRSLRRKPASTPTTAPTTATAASSSHPLRPTRHHALDGIGSGLDCGVMCVRTRAGHALEPLVNVRQRTEHTTPETLSGTEPTAGLGPATTRRRGCHIVRDVTRRAACQLAEGTRGP